MSTYDILTF